MNHFASHKNVEFEGYYSKFKLPSGSTLVFIVCSVREAPSRAHLVSVNYISSDGSPLYQTEVFADAMTFASSADNTFAVNVPNIGTMSCTSNSHIDFSFTHPDFTFHATTTTHTPWSTTTNTPESWLINLPLPLHWHVHSLSSLTTFTLSLPAHIPLPTSDRTGTTAHAHLEKNWASSFPSAHMWVQYYDPITSRGICLAGGQILGLEAYLIGYRNKSKHLEIDFRPPFAMSVKGWSPFMTVERDWSARTFRVDVSDGWTRLRVKAWVEREDRGTFFELSAPFSEGHREKALAESMMAKVEVVVWKRPWLGWRWEEVVTDRFEGAALEFGGEYYPGKEDGEGG